MPTACDECPCMYDYIQCTALKDNAKESLSAVDDYTIRQPWCPLKEVVKCKDCRFYRGNGWCNLSGIHLEVNDDWFCADAELKIDEEG